MTTINLPRAVLEQALEAMRCAVPTGKITLADWHKSIAELEAVLAQQVKHVAWANIDSDRLRVDPATGNVSIGAQQAEPVEPVAWVRLEAWKSGKDWPDDCFTALPAEGLTPLCKCADTPLQRKPLTEEEIDAIGKALLGAGYGGNTDREFARAIERAHGIKE